MKSSTTTFQDKQNGAKKKKLSLFAIIGLVGILILQKNILNLRIEDFGNFIIVVGVETFADI